MDGSGVEFIASKFRDYFRERVDTVCVLMTIEDVFSTESLSGKEVDSVFEQV